MSAALVPGRILRNGWLLGSELSVFSGREAAGIPGDVGGNWTSGKGGGLGSRGDVAGEALPTLAEAILLRSNHRRMAKLLCCFD